LQTKPLEYDEINNQALKTQTNAFYMDKTKPYKRMEAVYG